MGSVMVLDTKISGLNLTVLNQIKDERGAVFHYLKSDNENFKGFGEAYYSKINPEVIKGWKLHKRIYQNFCVPSGAVKIVIFDDRQNSSTKGLIEEVVLNDNNCYWLLSMPPGLWYSFKCISKQYSLLANITNKAYDPLESITLPIINNKINYDWK
jgi:dTDP-4-dehydrorhamnose 3,5-epimerase